MAVALPQALGVAVFLAAFAAPPEEETAGDSIEAPAEEPIDAPIEAPAEEPIDAPTEAPADPPELSSSEAAPTPVVIPPPEPAPEKNPWLGGFGFFSPGILVGNFGDVDRALESDTALGEGGAPPPYAVTIGGGGGWLLGGVYVIRGKGFYYFTPSTPSSRGRSTSMGGGGGIDVGMVFYNRQRWMLYPFVGVGGLSTNLGIENRHTTNIDVAGIDLAPGEKTELSSGYFTFELGFAFQRLMFEKPSGAMRANGGFINGAEMGLLVSLHQSQWNAGDTTIDAMPAARMLGFYFRLLMGGGGISRWEAPKFNWKKGRKRK